MKKIEQEKKFGMLFAIIFFAIAVHNFMKYGANLIFVGFLIGALFTGLVSILKSDLLRPFSRAWYTFGLLMGKIVSPIVLAIIFFLFITPVALIGKLLGRDELKLKPYQGATYWVKKKETEMSKDSFKRQF